jgi:hypothetical protein
MPECSPRRAMFFEGRYPLRACCDIAAGHSKQTQVKIIMHAMLLFM